jgi:hypothetical protein
VSNDGILAIFLYCSLLLSSCVAPEERDGPEFAESNSVNLMRIIISLFSAAVMEHYPRTFPEVRTHLGKSLFDLVSLRAILIPNSEQYCDSIKSPLLSILSPAVVLPPRNCGISSYEILPYCTLNGVSLTFRKPPTMSPRGEICHAFEAIVAGRLITTQDQEREAKAQIPSPLGFLD